VPELFLENLWRVAAVQAEDPDAAFRLAWQVDKEPAEHVSVEGLLAYPLPFPAGWIADWLARLDRSFRYAMRSVDRGRSVVDLSQRHARLPPLQQGFIIETVEAGSIRLGGVSSDDIQRFLQSKPVVFVGGLITALGLLHLEPHIEFGDHAAAPPPVTVSQKVVNKPEFRIVINVDGQYVPIQCRPRVPEVESYGRGSNRHDR
jgi:hypothetical protein